MSGIRIDLTGRTVLVTGASSGLGAHFACVLANAGANLVLAARRVTMLEQLRRTIEDAGGRAIATAMDVTDESSTKAAFDAAQAAFGPVDSVIANAGVNLQGVALDLDGAAVDAIMAVNVRGVFLSAREGAVRMIAAGAPERRHGRIVLISSMVATATAPGLALYSASKAAVSQLGRVLAREWAHSGINVNIICPGYIETDITSSWFKTEGGKKQLAKWPRRRLMDASSLDAMVLYLASDGSEQVTGSSFTVDDGQSLTS